MKAVSQELFDYTVGIFRKLHSNPELGFDLPNTVALVEKELQSLGIPYTDRYGQSSLVGYIGNKEGVPTLGLRADMDALPVQEITGLPYASRNPGVMHACGHDSHTSILLAVAKVLKQKEAELPCNIRLIFQPSEECAVSGAKMMTDHGAAQGLDAVICTHCELDIPTGSLGIRPNAAMAACAPLRITYHGLTSHASLPEKGIDAVAMAVDAYNELKTMVAQEADGRPYIWQVGVFQGGEVHNVIPDLCVQHISFRFYDMAFADAVHQKMQQILDAIAQRYGGSVELDWNMSCGPVINEPGLVEKFRAVVRECLPDVPVVEAQIKKSSEDFSWFLTQVPGFLFRYGTYNEEIGATAPAHRPDFRIDEEAMKTAILAFVNFALNFGK